MLIVDIAKLWDQDRVLAWKMLLKRDLNEYYKDRYSLFLQAWI